MGILKFGKRQALKMTISVVLLFFLALGPISSVYGQDGVQARVEANGPVVVSTGELNVRVVYGTVPHFWYWPTVEGDQEAQEEAQEEAYHVMFLQLIEYSDSDEYGLFAANETVPGATYALSSGNWEFSGFTNDTGDEINPGETSPTVNFNFTLIGPRRGGGGNQEPGPPTSTKITSENLKIILTCHITSDENDNNKLKIDVDIENWNFASSDNRLALRTDFTSDEDEDDIIVRADGFQIGEAFFAYKDSATADEGTDNEKTVEVTANSEEKEEATGLKVWFNYPSFTDTLYHDPTIGIGDLSAETGLLGGFGDGTGTEILASPLVTGISTVVVVALIVGIIYIGKRK